MMGEGHVYVDGKKVLAADALAQHGLEPITLAAKEGLALINGTQVSTALALRGYFLARDLLETATIVGSLSIDAAKGSDAPFDARIHEVRGHHGQIEIAKAHRQLLKAVLSAPRIMTNRTIEFKTLIAYVASHKSWVLALISSTKQARRC